MNCNGVLATGIVTGQHQFALWVHLDLHHKLILDLRF